MADTKTKKKQKGGDEKSAKADANGKGSKGSSSKKGADPFEASGVSPERALELLQDMLLYRRFEEKAEEAYAIGKIGGFCHLHIGQEGVAAGSIAPLDDDDYVISAYREHTQALAKGVTPNAVMAELYGREDGASGGKGGSMHIFDAERRFMGGHGIVGGQVPLAAGIAWKIKYKDEPNVVVCFMGDAAVNQGAFHESMNLAAIWNLPAIFVVENNAYGMGTAFSRVSKTDMSEKATPHGIPASTVNGQDVLATYAHFRDLAEEVRDGGGPRFVNVECYRFRGHSMSDPVSGTYRPTEELDKMKKEADPIAVLRSQLTEAGHLDEDGLKEMDAEARKISQEAADFADASPQPGPEALYAHVWAQINENGRLFFDGRGQAPEGGR